jgi:hypothetical protein
VSYRQVIQLVRRHRWRASGEVGNASGDGVNAVLNSDQGMIGSVQAARPRRALWSAMRIATVKVGVRKQTLSSATLEWAIALGRLVVVTVERGEGVSSSVAC